MKDGFLDVGCEETDGYAGSGSVIGGRSHLGMPFGSERTGGGTGFLCPATMMIELVG